ncbi:MAG: hypothetical protein LBE70_04800 [Nitrososphaerota archaeon]|jgi:hypothetical protein|nr:hypothetical protein [Nitrososphaerota archaeon]
MSVLGKPASRVKGKYRGALAGKQELIDLFRFLDENVQHKKYLDKPYYNPKDIEYGLHNRTWQGYRPVEYGTYKCASEKFAYRGKPVSLPTLLSRIRDFPNGVKPENKPYQKGAKTVSYEKWEQTPTYKLIMTRIKADKNSIKNIMRNPQKYKKETTKKRDKYLHTCFLAWKAMGQNVDPLDAELEDWLKVWGEDPKTPNLCTKTMRDKHTGLIMYTHTTGLRWIMKNSNNQHVKDLIITGDERFNTKGHKRQAGQSIAKYFTEEQCFLLPQALNVVDTLLLSYFGILFGGRFSALSDITPEKIDCTIHVMKVFESKVQKEVNKKIFEPESSFICQYVKDLQIGDNQPLFSRSMKAYNAELSVTKQYFSQTRYPLKWKPTLTPLSNIPV